MSDRAMKNGCMAFSSSEPGWLPCEPGHLAERLAWATEHLLPRGSVNWTGVHPGRAYPSHIGVDAAAFRGVAADERALFAKVYHGDAARFFDLSDSVAAASLAARNGLGPALVSHDRENGVVLFEALAEPWRVATCADLRDRDRCAGIIAQRRAWSGLTFADGVADDAFERARGMARLAEQVTSPEILAGLDFLTLLAAMEQIGTAFAASGSDVAPILGDSVVSNIMLDDAGGVRLVDFDFAALGDPLRDIAGFCLEACCYDDDGVEAIVEMHLGAARPDILARVLLLMLVEDFIWGAWALSLHGTSPRKHECEFFAYAGTRLFRAGHLLASIDLSSLTRAI